MARIATYPFYKGSGFNTEGFARALEEESRGRDKIVVLLNFPNNPTGYMPTPAEGKALVEALRSTGLLREDAAIGLVFPVLFSVAVIVISRYGGNVHLDTDAVLLGELALSPFRRLEIGGVDLGPRTLWRRRKKFGSKKCCRFVGCAVAALGFWGFVQ